MAPASYRPYEEAVGNNAASESLRRMDISPRRLWITLTVPTLVPEPGSLNVTQEHPPGGKSDALRALGLPWVMLDREIRSENPRVGGSIDSARLWPILTLRAASSS